MTQVRIVTDSASDITPAAAAALGVPVVPLSVHFGETALLDGVQISAEEFYQRLATDPRFPRTSQPAVGSFERVYTQAREDGVTVVSIHISAKLSGTLHTAMTAARNIGAENIHFVDSMGASVLEGELVRIAAQLAREGLPAQEIIASVEAVRPSIYGLIMLDNLAHLQRGGRIGRATSLLGTLLSVKPIIEVANGEVAPVQRVRTTAKALQELANDARTRLPLARMAIVHSHAPQLVEVLRALLQPFAPEPEIPAYLLGPVIGVHTGAGAIGVMTVRKSVP